MPGGAAAPAFSAIFPAGDLAPPVSTAADENWPEPTTTYLAASGEPLHRPTSNPPQALRRLRQVGRVLITLVAVAALGLSGAGWNYLRAKDHDFIQVPALDVQSPDIVDPAGQLGDENFLIAGTDSRAGANSEIGAGTTDNVEGARSDTVMLVNIPASRQRVVVVSFPRDLDVSRPACEGWDNDKGRYTGETFASAIGDKLNATYALGGPKCLTKVIQKLSGLKINHFVAMDFTGFEAMVDTIGGVEVCTTKPLIDDELGTVLGAPGRQTITGETALNYVRARHVAGEERSDYDRINRQQRFLSALLRGALSGRVLFDPVRLNGLVDAFAGHAFMDHVSTADLLMLGRSLQKMAADAVTFLTVPTAGTTSYGNEIPRETDIRAIFRAIIDDQPLPGEKKAPIRSAAPPHPLAAVDPDTVSVQVSNGSGIAGAASATASKLAAQGFQIYSVGNYSGGRITATAVRYGSGHEAQAATVASALPGAVLQPVAGLGGIVEVALGSTFTGAVHAPAGFGAQLPRTPAVPEITVTLPADLEHVNAADETCR